MQMTEFTAEECELTADERFDYYLLFTKSGRKVNEFKLKLFIEHLNLRIQEKKAA